MKKELMERSGSLPCFIFEVVLAHLCQASMVTYSCFRVHNEDAFNCVCAHHFKCKFAMMDGAALRIGGYGNLTCLYV